jgi:Domain of unknown function (DUF4878)
MKKIFLSIAVIASITLFSCGGGNSSKPSDVAMAFLTAMNKADYETAKKLGTDDTKKLLEMTATFTAMMPDSVKKLSASKKVEIVGEPTMDGDKAVVNYKESDSPEQKSLNLVKKEGKWLVQQSKDNAGAPAAETPSANADEAVKIAADSAKTSK